MIKRNTVHPEMLLASLREYEYRYEVRSASLAAAFTVEGRLKETEDFLNWSQLWSAYQRAAGSQITTAQPL